MIKAIRRLKVPDTDKELFKAVANHLQVEKPVRKTKVYKVLTAPIQEVEAFHKERARETPAPQQGAPVQTASSVKCKAPKLTASILKFLCTPFNFM